MLVKFAYAFGHGQVYLVDFKCESSAYVEFALMRLEELNAQFPKGSTKLARYHDLASSSDILLIETDDPTLAIGCGKQLSTGAQSSIPKPPSA